MNLFNRTKQTTVTLGDKKAVVAKLTPVKTRQAFAIIENIPAIALQVLAAKPEDRQAYMLVAIDESIEEVCALVGVLSDVDSQYIINNVGVDEIVEYLVAIAKANNLDELLRNSKSLMQR